MSHTPRRAAASSTMPVPCLTNRRRVIGALCAGSLAGWLATGPGLAGQPALAAPSAPATTGRHLSAYASEAEFDAAPPGRLRQVRSAQ